MTILDEILQSTRESLERRKKEVPWEELRSRLEKPLPAPGFKKALGREGVHLIAELKKSSPSNGVIRQDFDAPKLAKSLEGAGSSGISVLTEEKYFGGELSFLDDVRRAVALPLLRKDFIMDEYQVHESKLHGADAILLIASILTRQQLQDLAAAAFSVSLDVLLEIHDETELDKAQAVPEAVIGVNTRNLKDFSIDLQVLPRLMQRLPAGRMVICESGVKDTGDLALIMAAGARGVLVGTSLMRAPDPAALAAEFAAFLKQ
ncbi:MAG: indole-3-glycerol phosphate synthase TrpC [Candidatus Omnitrophota bacterium]